MYRWFPLFSVLLAAVVSPSATIAQEFAALQCDCGECSLVTTQTFTAIQAMPAIAVAGMWTPPANIEEAYDQMRRTMVIGFWLIIAILALAFAAILGIIPPIVIGCPWATGSQETRTPLPQSQPSDSTRPALPQFTPPPDPYSQLSPESADRLRELDRERDQAIDALSASSLDQISKQYAINEIRAEYQAKTAQAMRG